MFVERASSSAYGSFPSGDGVPHCRDVFSRSLEVGGILNEMALRHGTDEAVYLNRQPRAALLSGVCRTPSVECRVVVNDEEFEAGAINLDLNLTEALVNGHNETVSVTRPDPKHRAGVPCGFTPLAQTRCRRGTGSALACDHSTLRREFRRRR